MTTDIEKWKKVLKVWGETYNVDISIVGLSFGKFDYDPHKGFTYGMTYFHYKPPGSSDIAINDKLSWDLSIEETLWHEFCHTWEWQKYGTTGHGERFKELYSNRNYPWYCPIVQCIDAIIGTIIERDRKSLISVP